MRFVVLRPEASAALLALSLLSACTSSSAPPVWPENADGGFSLSCPPGRKSIGIESAPLTALHNVDRYAPFPMAAIVVDGGILVAEAAGPESISVTRLDHQLHPVGDANVLTLPPDGGSVERVELLYTNAGVVVLAGDHRYADGGVISRVVHALVDEVGVPAPLVDGGIAHTLLESNAGSYAFFRAAASVDGERLLIATKYVQAAVTTSTDLRLIDPRGDLMSGAVTLWESSALADWSVEVAASGPSDFTVARIWAPEWEAPTNPERGVSLQRVSTDLLPLDAPRSISTAINASLVGGDTELSFAFTSVEDGGARSSNLIRDVWGNAAAQWAASAIKS